MLRRKNLERVLRASVCLSMAAPLVVSCSGGDDSAKTGASPKKPPAAACSAFSPGDQANQFEDKPLGVAYVVPNGYKEAAPMLGVTVTTPTIAGANLENIWSFNGARRGEGAEVVVAKLSKSDPLGGVYVAKTNQQDIDDLVQSFKSQGDATVAVADSKAWGTPDCPAADVLITHTPKTGKEAEDSIGVQWSKQYFAFFGKGDTRWMVSAFDDPKGTPDPAPTTTAQLLARSLHTL